MSKCIQNNLLNPKIEERSLYMVYCMNLKNQGCNSKAGFSKVIGPFEVSTGKFEFEKIYFRFQKFDSNLVFSNKKFRIEN